MLTSLFTGTSGIKSNITALSVIGNNLANVNTVGFKASRPLFADLLGQRLDGFYTPTQIGRGVYLMGVSPIFSQGALETTANPLDLAIDGNGFFVVGDQSGTYYTRAGQFAVDKDGYIVNSEGYALRGYQADSLGNIGATMGDLTVSTVAAQPNATSNIDMIANLDVKSDVTGYMFTAGVNDAISFSIDGGPAITASLITEGGLREGEAYTGDDVVVAIRAAMEAAATAAMGSTHVFDASYDDLNGYFTVSYTSGTGTTVDIDWMSGASTAQDILGFDNLANDSLIAGASATSDLNGGQFFVEKAAETSNFSTVVTVYDSLGNARPVTVHFRKDVTAASGNTWEWFAVVDAADSESGLTEVQAQGTLEFTNEGALSYESPITYPLGGFDFVGGVAQDQAISFDFGESISEGDSGFGGVTQYGEASAVYSQHQDGYPSGHLQRMYVDSQGIVNGIFSNGKSRAMGQIALATIPNPEALMQMGASLFASSTSSGEPLLGAPGSSGFGSIHASTLELSTVDIAEEFVKMISAQRGFQANSRVISTTDEILAELVNLKR